MTGVGTREIRDGDIRAMLEFVGDLNSLEGPGELRDQLLPRVRGLVPCDIASYNEVDFSGGEIVTLEDPAGSLTPDAQEVFLRFGHQNPLVSYYQRTRDGRPYKWSDMFTRRELHRTDLYREAYGPMNVEYQMAFAIPAPADLIIGIALNRGRRDFAERDRSVLNVIRAPIVQAMRTIERYAALLERVEALERGLQRRGAGVVLLEHGDAGPVATLASEGEAERLGLGGSGGGARRELPAQLADWVRESLAAPGRDRLPFVFTAPAGEEVGVYLLPARSTDERDGLLVEPVGGKLSIETLQAAGLTRREADVMRLVALGRSDADVAAELVVSPRTVHKHLQNIYDKLGARSRTEAAATAWSITRLGGFADATGAGVTSSS